MRKEKSTGYPKPNIAHRIIKRAIYLDTKTDASTCEKIKRIIADPALEVKPVPVAE